MSKFKVTKIQFLDTSYERQIGEDDFENVKSYSANVFINEEFIIQVSGVDDESHKATFAPSSCCYATTQEAQEFASDNYDIDEIIDQIEAEGFENNFGYLLENSDESL